MADIEAVYLENSQTGNIEYPVTSDRCVFDDDGNPIRDKLGLASLPSKYASLGAAVNSLNSDLTKKTSIANTFSLGEHATLMYAYESNGIAYVKLKILAGTQNGSQVGSTSKKAIDTCYGYFSGSTSAITDFSKGIFGYINAEGRIVVYINGTLSNDIYLTINYPLT